MAGVRKKEKTREDFEPHEYLIYFIDRPGRNWWDIVFRTRVGFKHCFCLQWCGWSHRWIMVDWRQSTLDFMVFFDFEAEIMLSQIGCMKGTVVRFTPPLRPDSAGYAITYCSNMLSRFLGLGNSVLLTPFGLYRRLLKSGGEVVFDWRDVSDGSETKTDGSSKAT